MFFMNVQILILIPDDPIILLMTILNVFKRFTKVAVVHDSISSKYKTLQSLFGPNYPIDFNWVSTGFFVVIRKNRIIL